MSSAMGSSRLRISLAVWFCWLLVALLLRNGPPALAATLRVKFQEATGLALAACDSLGDMVQTRMENRSALAGSAAAETDPRIAALEAENRALKALSAKMREELNRLPPAGALPKESESVPLVDAAPLSGRALGVVGDRWRSNQQLYLSLGRRAGLLGEELVLKGDGVLIDQGTGQGVGSDQLVTAGRVLFGRTVQVGTWTTLVQPVTDSRFRLAARIIRSSSLGPVLGPRGILQGTGSACRLDEVAATEAVAVGDDVYSDNLVSPTGEPIYIGRIIGADIGTSATQWSIEVAPTVESGKIPSELLVYRMKLNPQRIAREDAAAER